jgi:ribonuclease P protein component
MGVKCSQLVARRAATASPSRRASLRRTELMRWYHRLQRSGEIAFVRRRSKAAGLATLDAYAAAGRGRQTRVAVTVSKAVGKAIVRNLVRRRIRGALDACPPLETGLRLLIVAKPAAAAASYESLASDVGAVLGRLRANSGRAPAAP